MRDYEIYSKIEEIIRSRRSILLKPKRTSEHSKFLTAFNYCLGSIKDEFNVILENSYIHPSYHFWWLDYYSKSAFYRKRFFAAKAFVSLFELIYENFNDYSVYITNV